MCNRRKAQSIAARGIFMLVFIGSASAAAQSNALYTYDALGRLTKIDYPATVGNVSGTKSIAFGYDAAGNRTDVTFSQTPALNFGNSPPVAAPDNYVAVPQVPTEMNVLWNDRDPNQQALILVLTSGAGPTKGALVTVGNKFVYTADANQTGTDEFYYRVYDGTVNSNEVKVSISINELAVSYWSGNYCLPINSNNACGTPFTGLSGTGMVDANFGTSPPAIRESTIHLTSNADSYTGSESARQVFAYLGPTAVPVARIAVAPIHTSYTPYAYDLFLTTYVQYSPDGVTWYASDENIAVSPVNSYLQINMAQVPARWIALTMPRPNAHLGIGDFRVYGVGSFSNGDGLSPMSLTAVQEGGLRYVAPAVLPPKAPRARFESALPRLRPLQILKDIAAIAAEGAPAEQEPDPPPSLMASLPGSSVPIPPTEPVGPEELLPRSYIVSSRLAAGEELDPQGMRDGAFSGEVSTARTSISTNEYLIADLGQSSSINRIDIAPVDGVGPAQLNGAAVYVSSDCERWTWVGRVDGVREGAYSSVSAAGASARCVKVEMSGSYLSVGDLRIF